MSLSRRSLIRTGQAATVASILSAWQLVAAQSAPVATTEGEIPSPQELYQALLASKVTTPLFPANTGPLAIVEWVDESDDDLTGTIGGMLMRDTSRDDADAALLGAYIVHPTATSAVERLTGPQAHGSRAVDILGYQGAWEQDSDGSSVIAVARGNVIVSAIGIPGGRRGPDQPAAMAESGEAAIRALANLAGMLDHLRLVLTPLAG